MNSAANVSLELDDIQRGVLQQRPSPYVGTYLLLRIDERTAGRELVRRLLPAIGSASSSANPTENASVSVAFTYRGLEALGVPQESLDSFAPEFRQGMAARATELGDRGESAPHNWEKPLGTSEVHVAVAALSRDSQRLEAMLERARRAHQELSRSGGHLAPGLLPAPDGPHFVRVQGRDRPAGGRVDRDPRVEPA